MRWVFGLELIGFPRWDLCEGNKLVVSSKACQKILVRNKNINNFKIIKLIKAKYLIKSYYLTIKVIIFSVCTVI